MTQIVFLRKADLPTKGQIQDIVQKLGYDFKIFGELEKLIDQDGLECSINGLQTYFETYVDDADNVINDHEADWIKPEITNQDTSISFVWGADFAAGACIGLISIALINQCNALVFYIDDQMKYTKELLIADTPQFLAELEKQSNRTVNNQEPVKSKPSNPQIKNTFFDKLKNIFK